MADQKSPVVTLTPSPTLDRTYFVKNLVEGGVNRAYEVGEELAGKGINVARGLQLAKIPAPGVVPIGNAGLLGMRLRLLSRRCALQGESLAHCPSVLLLLPCPPCASLPPVCTVSTPR